MRFTGNLFASGFGSVWLERVVWDHEVAGSNPVTPTTRKSAKIKGLRIFLIIGNTVSSKMILTSP